jgi:hypothetical protein
MKQVEMTTINDLAVQIHAQTQDYARLQQVVAQAESVRDTVSLLEEITVQIGQWSDAFILISPLLPAETVATIREDAGRIRQQLAAYRDDFALQNFQQATKLTQLKPKVDRLRSSTKDAWCMYAGAKVAPYIELTSIAERLPSMTNRLDTIEGFLANASKLAKDLPTKAESVKQFHSHLAHLEALLSDLEGLPRDVRVFLDKLMQGTASFADVTQTVFDWCRAEGLADKLRIARF